MPVEAQKIEVLMKSTLLHPCVQPPEASPTVPATIVVVVVLVLAALLAAGGMAPDMVGATLTVGGMSAAATLRSLRIKIALSAR